MRDRENKDGYKILMYLRGEMTVELPCKNRHDAEHLLKLLTSAAEKSPDKPQQEDSKMDLIAYDTAELWKNGEMIALGLKQTDS